MQGQCWLEWGDARPDWICGQQQIIYCLKDALIDSNALACRLLPAAEPHECAYWEGNVFRLVPDTYNLVHCVSLFDIMPQSPPWCPSTLVLFGLECEFNITWIFFFKNKKFWIIYRPLCLDYFPSKEATFSETCMMWLPLYGLFGPWKKQPPFAHQHFLFVTTTLLISKTSTPCHESPGRTHLWGSSIEQNSTLQM